MARQKGIIKLKGTIGDITFYKTKDGYIAREKGGIDANRIANDPAFQRTRENGAEFGRAGKAGRLLRTSIRALLLHASDSRMVGRLTKEMIKVIQADQVSDRGLRNVIDGEAELLTGFEFNIRGALRTTLFAPYTAVLDRTAGTAGVTFEPFVPSNMINAPGGTTHFKIHTAGTAIDFEAETFATASSSTALLPWDSVLTGPLDLENALPAASTNVLFLVVGIEFYQEINQQLYPLKNGAFNALSVLKVSGL
ncbi:hypothetical protein [Flavobacterium macacae]|uniref:Uncharacterized protein n=1 Tax=Flavobacterium macacae TaxID=2488993 RepID=A0A3P3VZ47_9FLAO|nr:hypothetical protein [Flavobacterium macacae]RRJ88065.1 hypothetical protein EG849_14955 [Flavobacterium macacae]